VTPFLSDPISFRKDEIKVADILTKMGGSKGLTILVFYGGTGKGS
jgi:hypothetical protein